MALTVFNRLTREKEPFVPLVDGQIRIYVCGPTVYDHAHIGHAKTYVSIDVMVRYLRYRGDRVRCSRHGVIVAAVPWARPDAPFTCSFDDMTAWPATECSKTAIQALMRVS